MTTYYLQIKWIHIACVTLSGLLLLSRALMVLSGNSLAIQRAKHRILKRVTYVVDSMLLTAAITLTWILHQYPIVNAWLTAKVVLLVVYIVLGTFALRRAPTWRGRALCTVAAVAVYLFIASIAWWHDPRGALLWLIRS